MTHVCVCVAAPGVDGELCNKRRDTNITTVSFTTSR